MSISSELSQLSNDELKMALTDAGIASGPIVATTRKLYEKKLSKKLMAEGAQPVTGTEHNNSLTNDHQLEDYVSPITSPSAPKFSSTPNQSVQSHTVIKSKTMTMTTAAANGKRIYPQLPAREESDEDEDDDDMRGEESFRVLPGYAGYLPENDYGAGPTKRSYGREQQSQFGDSDYLSPSFNSKFDGQWESSAHQSPSRASGKGSTGQSYVGLMVQLLVAFVVVVFVCMFVARLMDEAADQPPVYSRPAATNQHVADADEM